jgi:hypothetical protein
MASACPRCGAVVADESFQFCSTCGAPLPEPGSRVATAPVATAPVVTAPVATAAVATAPVVTAPASADAAPAASTSVVLPPIPPAGEILSRMGPAGVGAVLAVVLSVAAAIGLLVPALGHHPINHSVVTTTSPSGSPNPTTPPSPTPTTSPTPVTAPTPTTAPSPSAGGAGGGSVSNQAASVTLPNGWTEDTKNSDSAHLILDGPQGLFVQFFTQQEPSSQTLTGVLQEALATAQKAWPDASVCQSVQSSNVPGNPAVPGAFEGVCFTLTPQNGASVPYKALAYAGLVQGNSFQLLVEADFFFPQSMSSTTLNQFVDPLVQSLQWRQISVSGGSGSGG